MRKTNEEQRARVLNYHKRHPEASARAIAAALDVPKSTVIHYLKGNLQASVDIADQLREFQQLTGFNQEQIALLLRARQFEVSRWLNGKHGASKITAERLKLLLERARNKAQIS